MIAEELISREDAVARIDPRQLDQLLHPMIDPPHEFEVVAQGLNASSGRRLRQDRLRRRHRGRAREERRQRHPRPVGDDPRRHPRDDRARRDPDRARRDDLARGGRRARDGQAVRHRLRRSSRSTEAARHSRSTAATARRGGRRLTIDGGTGAGHPRPRSDSSRRRSTRSSRRLLGWADDASAPQGARKRRHPGRRRQGARVRRRGDRPLPDRAHVHGRGAARRRPRDDPGRRARTAGGARSSRLLPHQQTDFEGIFEAMAGLPRHDPAARPAAARVPAAARRGDRRAHGPTGSGRSARRTRCSGRAAAGSGCMWPEIYEMQVRAIVRAARGRARSAPGQAPLVEIMHPLVGFARGTEAAARDDDRDGRRRGRRRVPGRDDDRAPARVRPCGRDRRARRLLLVRDERPHADGARLLARRRGGQVPDATTSRTASSSGTRSRRSTRPGSATSCASPSSGPKREARDQDGHLRRARRRAEVGRVLPRARPRLRVLLAVPRAAGAPRCGAGRAQGVGNRSGVGRRLGREALHLEVGD